MQPRSVWQRSFADAASETVELCCVLEHAGNQHYPPSWVEASTLLGQVVTGSATPVSASQWSLCRTGSRASAPGSRGYTIEVQRLLRKEARCTSIYFLAAIATGGVNLSTESRQVRHFSQTVPADYSAYFFRPPSSRPKRGYFRKRLCLNSLRYQKMPWKKVGSRSRLTRKKPSWYKGTRNATIK